MYLTKMAINPARRGARLLLASPQAMHAAVLGGFASEPAPDRGRILWRLDRYSRHRVVLFVASPDRPDFTHIVEQAGWPTTEAWETRSYDRLLDALASGQVWQFRLTANPVRSGRRAGWQDTKPLGHVTVSQQEEWLVQRAARLGIAISESTSDHGPVKDGRNLTVVDRAVRRFGRNGSRVTIATATFEGHLEVLDPVALRDAMTWGIGRAKAYGCGLLTLARPGVGGAS